MCLQRAHIITVLEKRKNKETLVRRVTVKKKLRVYHAILYSFEAMNMIILKTFLGKQSNNRSVSCSV